MLIDARSLPNGSVFEADVCVIGSGPAGLTLAQNLGDARVVLLESGGFQPDPRTQSLARGDIVGEPYWALESSRLRCLGGTSGHWTGWCRPLDAIDFRARGWVEHSGWPLSRDELVPFYRAAHEVCDLGAFDYDVTAWAAKVERSLLPTQESDAESCVWQFSRPTRFGEKFRATLEESSRISAFLYANVTRINTTANDERVSSIDVACLDGPKFRVKAGTFVLAAGGLENPRLLLASSSSGLGNRHGLVGRYFLEHVHAVVGVLCCDPSHPALRFYDGTTELPRGAPRAVQATLSLRPEVQEREQLLNLSLQLEPLGFPLPFAATEMKASLGLARALHGVGTEPQFNLSVRAEQYPHADSRVKLGKDTDALGMRKIALDWRPHQKTSRSIRRSVELLAQALGRAHAGRIYSYIHGKALAQRVWPNVYGGHHHMGTTRMHDDARQGVVDRDCRVHGVANLYVAGSSVFPSAGYANPTLTLVALSLRLAHKLRTNPS